MKITRKFCLGWSLLGLFLVSFQTHADVVRVAAASSLNHALPALAAAFEKATGHTLSVSYGASGNLTRQIERGAPFDIFFSADESHVQRLVERDLTRDVGALYALGELVLFVPAGSPIAATGDLSGLATALQTGTLRRLALANPEHAPYGRAAQTALTRAGLWQPLQNRQGALVIGESVAQAARFVLSGDVDAGLIPRSLAIMPVLDENGDWAAVDPALYQPLRQRMVLLRDAPQAAVALYDFAQTPAAQAILAEFGFATPVD